MERNKGLREEEEGISKGIQEEKWNILPFYTSEHLLIERHERISLNQFIIITEIYNTLISHFLKTIKTENL